MLKDDDAPEAMSIPAVCCSVMDLSSEIFLIWVNLAYSALAVGAVFAVAFMG
jgi:hypothetical protein